MQHGVTNTELKPCPFCGGEAYLVRKQYSHLTMPTKIKDKWVVECSNGCCSIPIFEDEIYHDDDGVIVINHNGAEEAINAWNRRAGCNNSADD